MWQSIILRLKTELPKLARSYWAQFCWAISVAAIAGAVIVLRGGTDGPWKELSAIVAGLLAILAIVLDPRDDNKKLTIAGRVILSLTIVSAVFSIVAQFRETAENEKKSASNQANMLALLERTQATVRDLSRSMQPIEKPTVNIGLDVNCSSERFRMFCDKALEQEKDAGNLNDKVGSSSEIAIQADILSSLHLFLGEDLLFYRKRSDAEAILNAKCADCLNEGDLRMVLNGQIDGDKKNVTPRYDGASKKLSFEIRGEGWVTLNSEDFMSVPDFVGSTLVLRDYNKNLDGLVPSQIIIQTPRGQLIAFGEFQQLAPSIFLSSFGTSLTKKRKS
jgi:hypothetical protein